MGNLRGNYTTFVGTVRFVTEDCYSCHVVFAMTEEQYDRLQSNGARFYCPNGHGQHYVGKTDKQKLAEAETRLQAKDDQLRAAIRSGDEARRETLRIRQRIANGVCPCCTRSFSNLRNHIARKHPEFGMPGEWKHQAGPFRCSCSRKFDTFAGLRVHQGAQRTDDWDKPDTSSYWAHLTVV